MHPLPASPNPPPAAKPPGGPREVFESHFGFVWRNLRRLGVREHQTDDACQDVFLVVHRRWDSFDARWSSLETWLFGILLRVAKTHRRGIFRYERWLDRKQAPGEVVLAAASRSPDDEAVYRERVRQLERMLERLKDNERELFVMVDIEELTVPQAAEALGVNVNTAYSRLREARRKVNEWAVKELVPKGACPDLVSSVMATPERAFSRVSPERGDEP